MADLETLYRQAVQFHKAGDLASAEARYAAILAQDPNNLPALEMVGVIYAASNRPVDAAGCFEKVLVKAPNNLNVLNNFGVICRRLSRLDDAESAYRKLLSIDPANVDGAYNLANLLAQKGELVSAIDMYADLRANSPANEQFCLGLAAAHRRNGGLELARDILADFVEAYPASSNAYNLFGVVLSELNELPAAQSAYQSALAAAPDFAEAHNNLGLLFLESGADDAAEASFAAAEGLAPKTPEIQENLATVYRRQGKMEKAAAAFASVFKQNPSDALHIRKASLLPVIPQSVAEINDARDALEENIVALSSQGMSVSDPFKSVGVTQFHLSYHNASNKSLNTKMASLYQAACPELDFTARHCRDGISRPDGKIHVGFVSRYFRTHAIGWCYHGLMRYMPRDRISLTAISFGGGSEDALWSAIAQEADDTLLLPLNLAVARERIASLELDILVYTDIGMEPFTYYLAFSRLAPVQCVTNGHPDTTGIPTLDYFLSGAPLAPENAAGQYSETLINLPDALAYYERPDIPENAYTRNDLGLPLDKTVYLCPQSLFKIHPEMDRWFAEILARDELANIVIFQPPCAHWLTLLMKRLSISLGRNLPRIIVLPRLPFDRFLQVLAHSDVILDTWPFGGGNTAYQAFAAGTPVVTLPSDFVRGRSTFALYNQMGISDAIAGDPSQYVDLAVRLGRNKNDRYDLSQLIQSRADGIFSDLRTVNAFEEFFASAEPKRPK